MAWERKEGGNGGGEWGGEGGGGNYSTYMYSAHAVSDT